MSLPRVPLLRLVVLVAVAAVTAALLAATAPASARSDDSALAEAAARVEAAQAVVDQTKTATKAARAKRDTIRGRVNRNTVTRDRAATRLEVSRRALAGARTRVRDARARLRSTPKSQRRDARNHLRSMRQAATARRVEKDAARSAYLDAQARVERASNALARAVGNLTAAKSGLDAARAELRAAQQAYEDLLAGISGEVTTAVANIPNRVGAANFRQSMSALAATGPDFMVLNEISGRTPEALMGAAPGYAVFKGGVKLTEPGAGNQSIGNAVMWRTDTYELVTQGRIKVVDDDRGFHNKKKFLWDRYATWVTLRRVVDGQITSVISTHMPTNPQKFPRQWGNQQLTRIQLYDRGMNTLVALVNQLRQQGRVLLGGDMNSHPNQGPWTAVAKMRAAGYSYTKDRGVMYLFHPNEASVPSSRQLTIRSDHPALVTTLQFG